MYKTSIWKFVAVTNQKIAIQRHPIIMTDADYDCIMDEIERYEKNKFEQNVSVNNDDELYRW